MTLPAPAARLPQPLCDRRVALALGLVAVAVVWFFGWTASPEGSVWTQRGRAEDYYNSEIEGFRAGHLWMATEVPAALRALANPYDPAQNAPYRLHDASFYRGHYYLYFGVTPAILFFWPVRALTGRYASETQGVVFFCVVGYLASLGLLAAARRRYFPAAGLGTVAAGALSLGLLTMVPSLLRRPAVYEIPIACAYAGAMLTAAALWKALHADRPAPWTALASLAYGLTVGARPIYLFGSIFLLVPLWLRLREGTTGRGPPALARLALATVGPIAVVGAALMLFNFERFGSPLEFGQHYQLSGQPEAVISKFGLRFLSFNLRVYLAAPAGLSAYFPYVTVIHPPPVAPGQGGIEDPFGVLPNLPFVALFLLGPLAAAGRPRLAGWMAAVAGVSLAAGVTLLFFCGASNRYMVDFLPGPVLVAALAVFALETRLQGWGRALARLGWGAALAWSALFGVLASIQHNDLLRINHPAVYAPLARLGNEPSHGLDELLGTSYGPLDLTLKFPTGRTGKLEPLLVSGVDFKSDYLYVFYPDSHHVMFGFEHTGYGGPVSEPVEVDFSREHRLHLELGALYPPREHPYFAGWPAAAVDDRLRRIRLSLDGEWLLDDPAACYDPVARLPRLGFSPTSDALGRKFSGVISAPRRVPVVPPDPFGAIRLFLDLPTGRTGRAEPLLTTGVTGRGDLIRIVYVDATHVRFVHDHWGVGGSSTPDLPINYADHHRIELSLGSLYPDGPWAAGVPPAELARARERVGVKLDSVTVLDVAEAAYPSDPGTIAIGSNGIGASEVEPAFTGKIAKALRGWKR